MPPSALPGRADRHQAVARVDRLATVPLDGSMDIELAARRLDALGNTTRLLILHALLRAGDDGVAWRPAELGEKGEIVIALDAGIRGGALAELSGRTLLFLTLSGLATGASWLCYYKALQMGNATEVSAVDKFSLVITLVLAFFLLQDVLMFKTIIGCILITIGTLMMIL